jgi:hypothetical protein
LRAKSVHECRAAKPGEIALGPVRQRRRGCNEEWQGEQERKRRIKREQPIPNASAKVIAYSSEMYDVCLGTGNLACETSACVAFGGELPFPVRRHRSPISFIALVFLYRCVPANLADTEAQLTRNFAPADP